MTYAVAVDIGGTFTDLVAFDPVAQRVVYTKSPTTYEDFTAGIMECFGKAGVAPGEADLLNHGTTLVINSLIQRRGARTALITTRGFRDVLEIARGNRPDPFDLHYQREEPLIPRELRFEVAERMGPSGEVLEALDTAGLRALCADLAANNIESVAIAFLHAWVNPAHEEEAMRIVQTVLPGIFVTTSSALSREWYEYERTSTAAANAFVGPQVNSYIRKLDADLRAQGFGQGPDGSKGGGGLYMMGSNGGLLSTDRICRQPIALVESGPIGGCIGAGVYAEALGFRNVVAFDMGGTTAKCALVEEGRFSVESVYYAGGYRNGHPIKSPVIDIVEVGSGGGSIAWLDAQNRLHVGPRSAGSTPGPVCYGHGGTEPTVTDANLVLGRLNPANFLGGELTLDVAAAREAIRTRIAEPLGLLGEEGILHAADGIVSIATVIMAGAIRRVSVEHGRDPRDFVLLSYGGGGPLHGSALAQELSIPTVVIPPEPGNFSAIGMLLADARLDDSETFAGVLDEATIARLEEAYARMEATARAALTHEFGTREARFVRSVEMRFRGQRHNIKVPIPTGADVATIRDAFLADYRRRYGHADAKTAAEFQALHLSAFARFDRPDISSLPRPQREAAAAGARIVHMGKFGHVEAAVYDRYKLPSGFSASGPAVIEEYGSTAIIWPGDRFEIGAMHEIRINRAEG